MEILKRFTLAAVVMLVLAAVAAPVYAACTGPVGISTRPQSGVGSYIWNPGVFDPVYTPASPYYAPFSYYSPPVTDNFTGFFWRLGYGDPALGVGVDSGDYFAYRFNTYTGDPLGNSWFYYYGIPGSFYYAGRVLGNWANGGDGCFTDVALPALPACECVLFLDQDGDEGYFALVGGLSTLGGEFFMQQPGNDGNGNAGPITLAAIPAPDIIGTSRDETTNDVTLQVTVADPTDGVYVRDSCACGPAGFLLYQQILPRGSAPPSSRDAQGWTLMTLPGGVAQDVTPFGTPVTVESICGASNTDLYLATKLVFDSNYNDSTLSGVDYVSGDSTRIECGPQIAKPGEPELEPTRKVRPDAPRTIRGTKRGR